ncbi:hypothetical protein niasHT_022279 [Heterodera trifolii]|uniref:G-protein coupled receptors family 1 profile domain-containing protein n=1 Tax=Heterodera trifolii TaxID=157864 RepID=A0ABD2K1S2_9BILA
MVLSNATLVFVTLKAKNLNSICYWLIGANSACIAIYSFTYFVQFGIVLISPSGIPLWLCCLLVSVPLFFLCCQYVLFPLIALDRLIGAVFPLKQMGFGYKRRYMLFALFASTSFGTIIVALAVNASIVNFSEKLVLCMTYDPVPSYFADFSWMLNICSIVLYLALWFRVKMMSSSASGAMRSNETINRKVLFSLMAIFLVETFGWVFNLSVRLLLVKFGVTESTKFFVMSYAGYLTQFSLALNGPILYATSTEYRTAFRKVFGFGQANLPAFNIQVVPMNGSGKTIGQSGKTVVQSGKTVA